jgi:hypothetical protein
MSAITLARIEDEKNMAGFYKLDVQPQAACFSTINPLPSSWVKSG